MPPINRNLPLGHCRSWNDVIVGRQVSESHQLLQNIGSDRHPTLTAFGVKVFIWPIDYSNAAILNPAPAGISDFHISEAKTGEHQEGDVDRWIGRSEFVGGCINCCDHSGIEGSRLRSFWHLDPFVSKAGQVGKVNAFVKTHFSRSKK